MKKLAIIGIMLTFVLTLGGCVSDDSSSTTLTPGMIKKNIVKGQTTQSDILKVFGSPNVINTNDAGLETWTYDRQSYESASRSGSCLLGGMGTNALGMGAVGGSNTASGTKSMILMIVFNEKDVVKDYSFESRKF